MKKVNNAWRNSGSGGGATRGLYAPQLSSGQNVWQAVDAYAICDGLKMAPSIALAQAGAEHCGGGPSLDNADGDVINTVCLGG